MDKYTKITNSYLKQWPEFASGDTISVTYKIDQERTQTFTGIVLYVKGSGISTTFCVRKIGANSIGVEKIMPLHSPLITAIEVNKHGSVRRKKIFYMRNRTGKSALKIADAVDNNEKTEMKVTE